MKIEVNINMQKSDEICIKYNEIRREHKSEETLMNCEENMRKFEVNINLMKI